MSTQKTTNKHMYELKSTCIISEIKIDVNWRMRMWIEFTKIIFFLSALFCDASQHRIWRDATAATIRSHFIYFGNVICQIFFVGCCWLVLMILIELRLDFERITTNSVRTHTQRTARSKQKSIVKFNFKQGRQASKPSTEYNHFFLSD